MSQLGDVPALTDSPCLEPVLWVSRRLVKHGLCQSILHSAVKHRNHGELQKVCSSNRRSLIYLIFYICASLCVCVCVWGNQRMNRLLSVLLELNFRSVLLACSLFPLVGKIWGGKAKWNIFHARVLARLPEKEKKGARRVYPNQISH